MSGIVLSWSVKTITSLKKPANTKLLLGAILIIVLVLAIVSAVILLPLKPKDKPEVLVGMDIAYGGEEAAISLIDEVEDYVNLIILGSLNLTTNTEALTRVCDYMYEKDLNFIVYVGFSNSGYTPPRGPAADFFTKAPERWGDKFLGVYLFDEVGGKLIDGAHSIDLNNATDYSEAAISYVDQLNFFLGNTSDYYNPAEFKLFSSDFALYWYDYLSGYDVVFGEFVGNHSREVTTALCRGAAKTLHKDWGAIITWSPEHLQPFLENPQKVYSDMVLAYQNGAKYIIVFNSPENHTHAEYGGLTAEHLEAMKNFWTYKETTQDKQISADTAFVLPRNYGYGFRGPDDRIWDKWEADALSAPLWYGLNHQLAVYGSNLDVVYETKVGDEPVELPYDKLIFWNGTVID